MITIVDTEHSSSISNVGGEISEAIEGEIVMEDLDDADATKVVAPPRLRHPLEHSWMFWFYNPSAEQKRVAWGSSIHLLYTFSAVEDFWSVYNNMHHPSKLAPGADFHCFKNKIEPKWEDPVCANGGKWTASFSRGKSDTSWLSTLLAMIGEQFDYGDEICGAVVSVRARQEKITLWTKNAANVAAQASYLKCKKITTILVPSQFHGTKITLMSIGRQWKEFLDYNDTIGFIFHEDARRLGCGTKNRYTV